MKLTLCFVVAVLQTPVILGYFSEKAIYAGSSSNAGTGNAQAASLRLIGGSSFHEGRVEVYFDGQWGTVCDDEWDDTDAGVVCRALKLGNTGTARTGAWFGQGSGKIILDDVQCVGTETDLFSCPKNRPLDHDCTHSEDAGVQCNINECHSGPCQNGGNCVDEWNAYRCECFAGFTGTNCETDIDECASSPCLNGATCVDQINRYICQCAIGYQGITCGETSIRLVGGSSSYEGRVEVFYNGQWGTVCDDLWNDTDAGVVCRALGLGSTGTARAKAWFGQGSGKIILDNVECVGTETDLFSCPHTRNHDCTHSEDAGVQCNVIPDAPALGLESGAIPDSSLTASSQYHDSYYSPQMGRLNTRGAWCARCLDLNQWIQVDLLGTYNIIGVATQGLHYYNQWVTSFKINCSMDGLAFDTVQDPFSPDTSKIFSGNSDRDTIVYNRLPIPVLCRYVRILPYTWHEFIALRMELYGTLEDDNGKCGARVKLLASRISREKKIKLLKSHPSGVGDNADPFHNVVDTLNGLKARRSSCYSPTNAAPGGSVCLSESVLEYILAVAKIVNGEQLQINALAGGCHIPLSKHYNGTAVDFQASDHRLDNQRWVELCQQHGGVAYYSPDQGHGGHVHCEFSDRSSRYPTTG